MSNFCRCGVRNNTADELCTICAEARDRREAPKDMTPARKTRMWAVVTKRGRVVAAGMVRHRVIDEACNYHWRDWSDNLWRDMKAAGYRCIRVTIQEARHDER